ncbi:MAG: RNA polymerase sigma factor [Proteobacteria bacterium]|nr:RNA polymerase sigma factor [Pseudomonadota bacterium]MDA0992124.1 RNA polymerase sigma factor [Pseudomonadota bacterium]
MTIAAIHAETLKQPLGGHDRVAYACRMDVELEDSALMLRYRDGDAAAFEALYRRHNNSLYRYLLRLSLNRDTAEDLFQEAWGKIINSRHNYRPTAKFSTFLFRVAHNCFIDHLRKNKRHTAETNIDPDLSPNPGEQPDQSVENQLARRKLDACLREIPPEQRDVFLLYEEAGMSIDEIATITSVNRETAKSRLRYAVGKLKVAFSEQGSPGSTGRNGDAE